MGNKSGKPTRWDLEGHDVDITVFRASSSKLRYPKSELPLGDWLNTFFPDDLESQEAPTLKLREMTLHGIRYTVPIRFGGGCP